MSCGIAHRCSSDPPWLWLWCRPAATAPILTLAREFPYAVGAALKKKKPLENCFAIQIRRKEIIIKGTTQHALRAPLQFHATICFQIQHFHLYFIPNADVPQFIYQLDARVRSKGNYPHQDPTMVVKC